MSDIWVCVCGGMFMAVMFLHSGANRSYDHAILRKVGLGSVEGALMICIRHLLAFRPILVTIEKAPPKIIYHCNSVHMSLYVSAEIYLALSSLYDRMCIAGVVFSGLVIGVCSLYESFVLFFGVSVG